MKLASLLALASTLYKAGVVAVVICKRIAPVLAILAVLLAKLSVGDFTGIPELISAAIAAAAAVHSGEKVASLTKSLAQAKSTA